MLSECFTHDFRKMRRFRSRPYRKQKGQLCLLLTDGEKRSFEPAASSPETNLFIRDKSFFSANNYTAFNRHICIYQLLELTLNFFFK